MTSTPSPAAETRHARLRRRTPWWIGSRIAGLCLLLLVGVALRQPSTWVRLSPGPVFNLQGHVTGDVTNHTINERRHGHFAILTVVAQRETFFSHLYYGLFGESGAEIVNDPYHQLSASPASVVVPDQGDPIIQMLQATNTAAALATSLTSSRPIAGVGSLLEIVNSPGTDGASAASAAGLVAGDVVTGVNGATVSSPTQLHRLLVSLSRAHRPISLEVYGTQLGRLDTRSRRVVLDESLMRHGLMGVLSVPWFANPAKLDITFTQVGGPSGGLMTTLAFLDARSTGDLTGGRPITGTGAISSNGAVGAVGGVAQKMIGAARAGYRVFFVPVANVAAARSTAPRDMTVIPGVSLAQAVTWLCAHGAHSSVCAMPALHYVRATHRR